MAILSPYKFAVKRRVIKGLMDNHSYTRTQARAAWSKIKDEDIESHSIKCGVNLAAFDFSSVLQWIKDNWKTILQVALSIIGVILMFADRPPNATNVSVRTETVDEEGDVCQDGDHSKT